MKKFTLILTIMLLTVASGYASGIKAYDEPGLKFGIEFGYDHNWHYASSKLQAISGTTATDLVTPATATVNLDGFHVGPVVTYCFNGLKGLYVNGAIDYQYATGKLETKDISAVLFDLTNSYETELALLDKINLTTHTLEIPIRIGYNYVWENGMGINVYVGPSFNFALDWMIEGSSSDINAAMHLLSGKMVYEIGGKKVESQEDYLKSYNVFDVAIGGGVGFTYKYIYLNLGCDWGLTNICKHSSFGTTYEGQNVVYTNNARSTQLKLSLGFRF